MLSSRFRFANCRPQKAKRFVNWLFLLLNIFELRARESQRAPKMHTHYLLLYAFSDTVLFNKRFFEFACLQAKFCNVEIQCAFVLSTLKQVQVCPCGKIFDARIKNVTNPYMQLVTPKGVFRKKVFFPCWRRIGTRLH